MKKRQNTHLSSFAQTADVYCPRISAQDLEGEWIPLEKESARRGSIIRCTQSVTTDTTGSNLQFINGDLAKITNIDVDGDVQLVPLTDSEIANLWMPGRPHWLLADKFKAFETRCPRQVGPLEAMQQLRAQRKLNDDRDDTG